MASVRACAPVPGARSSRPGVARAAASCRPDGRDSRPPHPDRARRVVLPSVNRMRRAGDFATVIRTGARARSGRLLVHHAAALTPDSPPLVGLVVGKPVGGSVVRHAVSRKLRAQLTARLDRLPAGSGTVVRVLPGGGDASSAQLGVDLDSALARLMARS